VATRWIDFTELKRQVSIRDVLARYGLLDGLQEKKPGKLVGPCPIHGGKNGTSFNVDVDKNVFHCFSECGGGNVLDLVMKIEGCTIREAGEKLADWFGLSWTRRRKGESTPQPTNSIAPKPAAAAHTSERVGAERANPPLERPLKDLNPDHPYLVERGLTVPTIKTFGIGYCTRGLMRGRIAIPIHDEHGDLVAYAGRAVDGALAAEKGKYRLPDGFKKSFVLFNLHRAIQSADRHLILVEGFFDCFRATQAGFPNVVALMGSTLSEPQEQLLLAHADRLTLFFDGDDAGTKCVREFYARLRRRTFLREAHLEPGEQPDTLGDERIRELLS
jgi:DNA primase